MKWNVLSREYLSNHQYFTARKDTCETPDGHIVEAYFVVELPVSVSAVAITEEKEVLMIRQYRHPIEKDILEIPGGFVDAGETSQEAMGRELLEETGYSFPPIIPLGRVAANHGILHNYTHLFLAEGGIKTAEQKLDKNEFLVVEKISVAELKAMLVENKIVQSLHANCVFYALLKMGMLK